MGDGWTTEELHFVNKGLLIFISICQSVLFYSSPHHHDVTSPTAYLTNLSYMSHLILNAQFLCFVNGDTHSGLVRWRMVQDFNKQRAGLGYVPLETQLTVLIYSGSSLPLAF